MSRILYLICLTFLINNNSIAQSREISLVPKIGVSINSAYNPSNWEKKFSPYLVGLELIKPVSSNYCISTDLTYIRKGVHSVGDKYFPTKDYIFDFLIVSANLNYLYLKKIRMESIFGLYAGYAFDSKVKTYDLIEDFDMEGRKVDFGMNFSLRKYLTFGNFDIFIEPKIQLGLITVSNSNQLSYQLIFGKKLQRRNIKSSKKN